MTTRQLAEAIGQAVDVPTRGFPRAEVETLWGAFLTGFRPAFVWRIVVHDQVNVLIRRHLLFQAVEEPDELVGAVPRQATANHLAIQNIEGGKQRCGPRALVVVRLTLWKAGP